MLEADHRLMFRFPRWAESARSLGREVRLLQFLERHLTINIPQPVLVGALDRPRGWPFFVYPKLPGRPLGDLRRLNGVEKERLANFLARLFTELSRCRASQVEPLGLAPGDRPSWAERFRRLELRYRRVARNHMPGALHRQVTGLFAQFYETLSTSQFRPTLLHGDLWPSHILWHHPSRTPVGVIDWEDARMGDPAFDLTTLGGIGWELFQELAAGRKSGSDRRFEDRLLFYRRILPLPGLVFGLETRQRALARDHLGRLSRSVVIQPS